MGAVINTVAALAAMIGASPDEFRKVMKELGETIPSDDRTSMRVRSEVLDDARRLVRRSDGRGVAATPQASDSKTWGASALVVTIGLALISLPSGRLLPADLDAVQLSLGGLLVLLGLAVALRGTAAKWEISRIPRWFLRLAPRWYRMVILVVIAAATVSLVITRGSTPPPLDPAVPKGALIRQLRLDGAAEDWERIRGETEGQMTFRFGEVHLKSSGRPPVVRRLNFSVGPRYVATIQVALRGDSSGFARLRWVVGQDVSGPGGVAVRFDPAAGLLTLGYFDGSAWSNIGGYAVVDELGTGTPHTVSIVADSTRYALYVDGSQRQTIVDLHEVGPTQPTIEIGPGPLEVTILGWQFFEVAARP